MVASGEQVTSGLLAIVLQGMGIQARSWQGWQIPILDRDAHASARILDIDGSRADQPLQGAQGRSRSSPASRASIQTGRITTLGRGGSDTSAVAIAAASRPTAATSTPTSMASIQQYVI